MLHKVFYRLVSLFLALAISFASLGSARAAAGALDPTFDTDGMVTTAIGSGTADDQANAIAVQPDGKILVAGQSDQGSNFVSNYDFALVRYNSDGSLDTTFDTDGIVTTDFGNVLENGNDIVLQPDGKIIVAGSSIADILGTIADVALARYNSDGSLDTTFDTDGKVTTDFGNSDETASAVALQPDGKIIVAGATNLGMNNDFALVRYNSDGSLDTTFDSDGILTTDFGGAFSPEAASSLGLQPDGKIIAAGGITDIGGNIADFALVRYNSDGSLDTTFDTDGKVTTDFDSTFYDSANAIALQPDGKIVVAGITEDIFNNLADFALARYNSDGSLDTTFDTDGKVTTDLGSSIDFGSDVALQLDGKIVMAGGSLLGGSIDFALARYNSDGSLDATFDTDGLVITSFDNIFYDAANAIALQPDGKIVAAGTSSNVQFTTGFDFAVVRYEVEAPAMEVTIDVRPGRFPNRIELEDDICEDDDNLSVAVLTTPAFDALTVDASSLKLGDPLLSGIVTPIRSRERDVDGDGDLDLVLVFALCDLVTNTALDSSSTELVLTGMTLDGTPITGKDSVKVVLEDDD